MNQILFKNDIVTYLKHFTLKSKLINFTKTYIFLDNFLKLNNFFFLSHYLKFLVFNYFFF